MILLLVFRFGTMVQETWNVLCSHISWNCLALESKNSTETFFYLNIQYIFYKFSFCSFHIVRTANLVVNFRFQCPLSNAVLLCSESQVNADLMQRLGLVPKLLFILQDETVTDATAHTIASVLSVLLSNTNEVKNLIR